MTRRFMPAIIEYYGGPTAVRLTDKGVYRHGMYFVMRIDAFYFDQY